MTIYFGADLHLDHKNILKFCDRPYDTVANMTESLLCDFEETVKPGDIVYLLGDIQFSNTTEYIDRITGIKGVEVHLVIGNHDNKKIQRHPGWITSTHYKAILVNGRRIILSHYPLESWHGRERGDYHFHGHTHNNASHSIRYIPNRLDVGYDKTKRVLVSYEEALEHLDKDYNYNESIKQEENIL